MDDIRQVVISGFADETCASKNLDQQFSVFSALGLEYFSIRFVEIDGRVKNSVDLNKTELLQVKNKIAEYGLRVSSLGSPIGKVKLQDVEDGTQNSFVPFPEYLANNVQTALDVACELETKLVRGFSFYHPRGTDAASHLPQTVEQLGQIADACAARDLTFGLEVEANLVGYSGQLLRQIYDQLNHDRLVLIFDGGNLITQGYDTVAVFAEYQAMKPGLGWIHVKDYTLDSAAKPGEFVDEEALMKFVPVEQGASGYQQIFDDLTNYDVANGDVANDDVANDSAKIFQRASALGLPGIFLDLEPHLKGGGQFGGYSGPDGFGLAFRSLCSQLDQANLAYDLRDLESVKNSIEPD